MELSNTEMCKIYSDLLNINAIYSSICVGSELQRSQTFTSNFNSMRNIVSFANIVQMSDINTDYTVDIGKSELVIYLKLLC